MRLEISLSPSREQVPFDHLPVLAGKLHAWLGPNKYHGELSLYSFSWLQGASVGRGGLRFPKGAMWMINSWDKDFLSKSVTGIFNDPEVRWGMSVREVVIIPPPYFESGETYFRVASPVLVKKSREDKTIEHLLFDNPESDDLMTKTIVHKLESAGLDPTGIHLQFDRDYPGAKSQMVNYSGINNRCSYCPVIATGTPEQLAFVWTVGIGHSTGVGFGAIK